MPWFKVDDQLAVHLKTITAGNAAMGLWVRAGSWCMAQLTDGFLPASMVPALGGSASDAAALVSAGLWDAVDEGWQFHDWAEYQPTKEQILADRDAAAERMRNVRANKKANVRPNERRTFGVGSPSPVPVPSPRTSTYVNESQSLDNRARKDDELSTVQLGMAQRAGLEIPRIRQKLYDQLGMNITPVNTLAVSTWLLDKPKKAPDYPTRYVLGCITRSPAEVQQYIHEAGLA